MFKHFVVVCGLQFKLKGPFCFVSFSQWCSRLDNEALYDRMNQDSVSLLLLEIDTLLLQQEQILFQIDMFPLGTPEAADMFPPRTPDAADVVSPPSGQFQIGVSLSL